MYKTKVSVLLVDDDPIHQYVMLRTLEASGSTEKITVCSNGKEALQFLENNMHHAENLPDIILLDINMPVMNGWEFSEEYQFLKSRLSKEIYVFLVTSSLDERDIQRYRCYDFIERYIVKPLDSKRVAELLSNTVKVKF